MRASIDQDATAQWTDSLRAKYNEDFRTFNPDRIHISHLVSCLRRPILEATYQPVFTERTLWLFTLGRAFEKAVFTHILPEATQELAVYEDGIVGHIDFGTDDLDYECKLTWKRLPTTDDEVQQLFEKSDYWVEQAGGYAIMRRRDACRFAVLHLSLIHI